MKTLTNLKFMLLVGLAINLTGCDFLQNENIKNEGKWSQVGASFDNIIYDVKSDSKGKIYVSGADLKNISVWDGVSWSRLGNVSETFNGGVYWPITIDNNDNVYAVGRISVPQANSEYHVAKFNVSTKKWINLTSNGPLFDNGIHSIVTDLQGNVYVAGNVAYLPSVQKGNYIYKWDGNTWTMLGGTKLPPSEFVKMHVDTSGNLFASFYNDNISPCVSKWNGSSWDELGGKNNSNFGTGQIYCINSDSKGNIYAGGYFVLGDSAFNLNKWTKETNKNSEFYTFESSLDVKSIAFDSADTLYVAGSFTNLKNQYYIAKYHTDRKLWSNYWDLNVNNKINSICFDPNGNLYAGGEFTNKDNKYYVAVYKKR